MWVVRILNPDLIPPLSTHIMYFVMYFLIIMYFCIILCILVSYDQVYPPLPQLNFQNWAEDEPNNHMNVESCVEHYGYNWHDRKSWNDAHCESYNDWHCQIRKGRVLGLGA